MKSFQDPVSIFQNWFDEEIKHPKTRIPSACCLSTNGLDGFPNARFVSLKEVWENQFIITGPTDSLKGQEIENNPRVALSFWWDKSGKQVRIQGSAKELSPDLAEKYFDERSADSRLVSILSEQGKPIQDFNKFEKKYFYQLASISVKKLYCPDSWGGWAITPTRIEFLTFRDSRLHYRELFTRINDEWTLSVLQP